MSRRLAFLLLSLVASLSAIGTARQAPRTSPQAADLRAFDGEWVYVEDRTAGRSLEQLTPPMGSRFSLRVEEGAVVLVSGHGGARREVRVALDGTATEVPGTGEGELARYRGAWKDAAFSYEVEFVRAPGGAPEGLIRREFRMSKDGLIVRSNLGSPSEYSSVGLYLHAQDIAMPTPAKAVIGDLAWLAGTWVGARGTNGAISFEERWSPPKGGAMLATSRTVSRDKMSAFEFLRIVEREGGLVYVAQPGGAAPTEFVLTELNATRAVFDNPRHDYPKRIVYELSAEGGLTATTGFTKGGSPRRFEFKREGGYRARRRGRATLLHNARVTASFRPMLFAAGLLGAGLLVPAAGLFAGQDQAPRESAWRPLFNGRNLDGWRVKITGYDAGDNFGRTFRVEDGAIKVVYDASTSSADASATSSMRGRFRTTGCGSSTGSSARRRRAVRAGRFATAA